MRRTAYYVLVVMSAVCSCSWLSTAGFPQERTPCSYCLSKTGRELLHPLKDCRRKKADADPTPGGRRPAADAQQRGRWCHDGPDCKRPGCHFTHPAGYSAPRAAAGGAPAAAAAAPPQDSALGTQLLAMIEKRLAARCAAENAHGAKARVKRAREHSPNPEPAAQPAAPPAAAPAAPPEDPDVAAATESLARLNVNPTPRKPQCEATKKDGKQCTRSSMDALKFCHQHALARRKAGTPDAELVRRPRASDAVHGAVGALAGPVPGHVAGKVYRVMQDSASSRANGPPELAGRATGGSATSIRDSI